MRKAFLFLGLALAGVFSPPAFGQEQGQVTKTTETYKGEKAAESGVNPCYGECIRVCFERTTEVKPSGSQATLVTVTEKYDGATYQDSYIVDKPLAVVNAELAAKTLKLAAKHKNYEVVTKESYE